MIYNIEIICLSQGVWEISTFLERLLEIRWDSGEHLKWH